jgi:exo-beta-1,3-glucanase (GH17 family)
MSYHHQTYEPTNHYRPQQDWREDLEPPVSPISANASLSSLRQAQYGHQVEGGQIRAPNRSVSPIKERYYSQMPPPPRHGGEPQVPSAYPRRQSQAPYMPTASDFSPPDPERRALADIDNIFGPRDLISPSPGLEDRESYITPEYPSTPPVQNRRPKPHKQSNSASSTVPLITHTQPTPPDESPSPTRRHRAPPAAAAVSQRSHAQPHEPLPYEQYEYPATPPRQGNMHRHTDSASSNAPLMETRPSTSSRGPPSPTRRSHGGVPATATAAAGAAAVGGAEYYRNDVPRRWQGEDYEGFDPSLITDDGDDGIEPRPRSKRSRKGLSASAAGVGTAAAVSGNGSFKVFDVRRGTEDGEDGYGNYPPPRGRPDPEKSEWLDKQRNGGKKLKWIIGSIILLFVIAAVVGGTTGGILGMKKSESNGSTSPASSANTDRKGLYDINSSEVKALLNNHAFHKVFPGMDYTPLNAQYPECIHNPPSQNNITLDIAQLAQLTPAVRLYGTDCNQTEMVLSAIDRLGYNDTLQVWLGVWLGNNATTNDRQLAQMESLLRTYPSKHFAGVIVGNEVLYRKDLTEAALASNLSAVRKTLADLSIDLPVATSDLGNDWTAELAADSDIVMANVHPFFAGVTPDVAPGWTWDFWQNHNVDLKTASSSEGKRWPGSIVAEVGWPSEGGTNCGGTDGSCASGEEGAIAGIDELNKFMDGWICESLKNGTTFFW